MGATKLDVHKLLHVQAFSAREFLETVISHDLPDSENGLRSFIVVSMPLEGNVRSESAVLGQYVSVDYVHELKEGGVEILLALCVSYIIPPDTSILTQLTPTIQTIERCKRFNSEVDAEYGDDYSGVW